MDGKRGASGGIFPAGELAEREGFEPPEPLRAHLISSQDYSSFILSQEFRYLQHKMLMMNIMDDLHLKLCEKFFVVEKRIFAIRIPISTIPDNR